MASGPMTAAIQIQRDCLRARPRARTPTINIDPTNVTKTRIDVTSTPACCFPPSIPRGQEQRDRARAALLLHARFLGREVIDRRAELAGHDHLAVLDHV